MNGGPIDLYLDNLFVELQETSPRDARSLLNEADAHLRDAADEAVRTGMGREEAEADAVRRFGEPRLLAGADRGRSRLWLARGSFMSAWALCAWGAVAIGVSGLVAGAMRLAGATNLFLAGPWSSSGVTGSDCRRWLTIYPRAGSCAQAAVADWATETVVYRVAFGILGLVALMALWLARRRLLAGYRWDRLPATVVDATATTIFTVSGVWMAGLGIDALAVSSGRGSGQWLSAALVALAVAGFFGTRLLRHLRAAG